MKKIVEEIGVKKIVLFVIAIVVLVIGVIVLFQIKKNINQNNRTEIRESEVYESESIEQSTDIYETEVTVVETETITEDTEFVAEGTEDISNSEISSSQVENNLTEDKTQGEDKIQTEEKPSIEDNISTENKTQTEEEVVKKEEESNSGQTNNNKPSYEDPHKKKYSSFEEVEVLINSGVITNYTWVETEDMKRYIIGDYSYANNGDLIEYDEWGNIIRIWEYGVLVYPTDNREPQPPSEPEAEEPDPLKPAKYTVVEADDFPNDGYAWRRSTFYWHLAYSEHGVNDELVAVRWEIGCDSGKVEEAIPNAEPFMCPPPTLEETKEMLAEVGHVFDIPNYGYKELYVCLED